MSSKKLNLSSLSAFIWLIFVSSHIFSATANAQNPTLFNLASLSNYKDNPLEIFNFQPDGKSFAPEACVPPPSNLISWYRGEGSGSDQQNANNATLTGTTTVAGKVGNAIRFDSLQPSGDQMIADGGGSLNVTGNQITLEAWLKLENNVAHPAQRFTAQIGKLTFPSNQSYVMTFEGGQLANGQQLPANQWQMEYILTNSGGARVHNQHTNVIVTADGNFHHYALVYNGTSINLYEDGILRGTFGNFSGNLISAPSEPLKINGNSPFAVDELSIYNRALSQTEIQAIFNAGSDGKCVAVCAVPPANQVSWYRAENNANDSAGTNSGTLQNGASFAAGKVGQSFSFDGVDDTVAAPVNAFHEAFSQITVESWVFPVSHGNGDGANGRTIVANTENDGFGLRVFNGFLQADLRLSSGDVSITANTSQLPLNQWSHIAFAYDGTRIKGFVNGAEVLTQTANGNVRNAANANNCLMIGNDPTGICTIQSPLLAWDGRIDEPSIYNRALSQTEIQAIFNAGSAGKCVSEICTQPPINQVSWYRAENSAADVLNNNNGTLQNGTTFAAGKVGQSFSFDGVDDFVQLPNNATLNAASRTVETWIKPETFATNFGGFIYTSRDPFFAEGFSVFADNEGSLLVNVRTANAPFSPPTFSTATNVIQLGQFQHVAVAYNASDGTLAAYVNGVNVPLNGGMTLSGAIQPSGSHFIGRRQDAASSEGIGGAVYFKGLIDELSIYNRALSQTEVQAIFNAGSFGKCLPTVPLQISPTTANLLTGATQNFTATGGTAPYTFSILTNNSGGSINASTGVYTAGNLIGTDVVRVTDANNQTADATVNVSSVATQLGFTVHPSNATAGQTISPAIQVTVLDANGNTMTNSNLAITIAFENNPNGGTLSGTLTRNAVNGIATFNDLSINRAANNYTLRATASGVSDATSSGFNITPAGATRLAFVGQPSNTVSGANIAPAPRVAMQDNFGNTLTDLNGLTVTIEILNNPANGTLSGQTQASLQNGIATFPNLRINNAGTGYTLNAFTDGFASATSAAFNIVSRFEVTNTNNSGAGSLRQAIQNANLSSGTQTITFNIPGTAPFKIAPTNVPLPIINDSVIIDATTQPGFNGTPIIELSGEAGQAGNITGFDVRSDNTTIKGFVINRWVYGLRLHGFGTVIQGNYIGTDVTGNIALPNIDGIVVISGSYNIGGAAATRNIISGNSSNGILSLAKDATINVISGNFIGTKADGVSALGNSTGIYITGNARSTVIGESGGFNAPNIIAFNSDTGIELTSGMTNIQTNSIHSNGRLGIDIRFSGVNTNDPQDADEGANGKQNYPVITSSFSSGGTTVVSGTLNSTPSSTFGIRLYSNDVCDSSGFGEGKNFLAARGNITTDASGLASFTIISEQPAPIGSFITATANTSDGSPSRTSEFSRCKIVTGAPSSISGRITNSNNQPLSGIAVKIPETNTTTLTDSNGNYIFNNLPGGFDYTIVPSAPGFAFNPVNRVLTNFSGNLTNQNFTGTRLFRVSGQITSVINGANFPISGATVTLSGASGATAQTDVNGNYVFNSVPSGNYQATPNKAGFAFLPSSVSLNVNGDRTANFSSTLTAGLSGRILSSYVTVGAFNADGSSQIYLGLSDTNFGCVQSPCQVALDTKLSRDGSKIAYIEATKRLFPNYEFINRKLYIANLDGSNRRLVYNFPAYNNFSGEDLSWSPDGTKIVFTEKQRSLKIINTDGTNLTTLLAVANEFYNRPDWSPDGTKILFGFNRSISVINVDGTNRRQLTSGTIDDNGKWSPNSAKIAFIRRPQLNATGRIFTMNDDGTAQTAITTDSVYANVLWSPDGAKLAFTKIGALPTNNFYGVVDPNGANLQIIKEIGGGIHSWSPIFAPPTPTGTNISTNVGAANITFNSVSNAGTTTIIPIPSYGAANIPGGYNVNGNTYEITTTANYSSPVTVCFTMPTEITERRFNQLSILHAENGVFVDRTSSRDYPTRRICATTASLSPFAIAEQIDAQLPSIKGLVQDTSGKPLVNVPVYLSGAETAETVTDSDGFFKFVNLTAGANYNVQPKQIGYLFSEPNQDFVDLIGENTIVFEGAQRNFSIGGKVTDSAGNAVSGVTVSLDGAKQSVTVSGKDGSYLFTDLPADGAYALNASNGINNFAPSNIVVSPLTDNTNEVNFQKSAPIAAGISISGRVVLPDDFGLINALVTLTDSNGNAKTVLTGKFGSFRFSNLNLGDDYTVSVTAKNHTFTAQTVSLTQEISDLIFTPVSPPNIK